MLITEQGTNVTWTPEQTHEGRLSVLEGERLLIVVILVIGLRVRPSPTALVFLSATYPPPKASAQHSP